MSRQALYKDMNSVLQIRHTKYGLLDKETLGVLSTIVRAPNSWLAKLTQGKFNPARVKKFNVFIAEDEGQIVGWCTANTIQIGFYPDVSKRVRCIEFNICVRPNQRGRGVASQLLQAAKKALSHKKRKWISFPFDEKGKRCYEKNGITTFRKGLDQEYGSVDTGEQ